MLVREPEISVGYVHGFLAAFRLLLLFDWIVTHEPSQTGMNGSCLHLEATSSSTYGTCITRASKGHACVRNVVSTCMHCIRILDETATVITVIFFFTAQGHAFTDDGSTGDPWVFGMVFRSKLICAWSSGEKRTGQTSRARAAGSKAATCCKALWFLLLRKVTGTLHPFQKLRYC